MQAMYDFKPQETGELELHRGDIIQVLNRSDKNWWKGRIGQRKGIFPATYVVPYNRWRAESYIAFCCELSWLHHEKTLEKELSANSTALYGFFKFFFYMGLFQVLFTRVFFLFLLYNFVTSCLLNAHFCNWLLYVGAGKKGFWNLIKLFPFYIWWLWKKVKFIISK